jgi:hypothetical protein
MSNMCPGCVIPPYIPVAILIHVDECEIVSSVPEGDVPMKVISEEVSAVSDAVATRSSAYALVASRRGSV